MSGLAHTPGPWQWAVRKDGTVYLVHPHRGYLTVMDFVRQGMQGAVPRFAHWEGDERENMGGIMVPATAENLFSHQDACLIAAAPSLLAACKIAQQWLDEHGYGGDVYRTIREAITLAQPK